MRWLRDSTRLTRYDAYFFFFFFFLVHIQSYLTSRGAVRDESGHYIHAVFVPFCIHCHIFIIFNFCICTVSIIFCVSPLFCLHFGVSTLHSCSCCVLVLIPW